MVNRKIKSSISVCSSVALLMVSTTLMGQEIEEIGGPYETDEHTILLMKFEDNLENESGLTEPAEEFGPIQFLRHEGLPEEFGKSLYLPNGSPQNQAFIRVPDTTYLDMTGSWTMELWVNLLTYGDSSDDHRWQPRIFYKPGPHDFDQGWWWWQNNFRIYARGATETFYTGYNDVNSNDVELISPPGTIRGGQWYHVVFIRDTISHVMAQVVHEIDENMEMTMTHFGSMDYDPVENHPPLVNEEPLYMGQNSQGNHWVDGFLNEVRISNVVRNFELPPMVTAVTQPGTVGVDEQSAISSRIVVLGEAGVVDPTIHYRVNGGDWQEIAMDHVEMNDYEGVIPEQEHGSIVEYYLSAETETGLSAVSPDFALEEDPEYYSYAVVADEQPLLGLDFEEGEGVPTDTYSAFPHEVQVLGAPDGPSYSDDAIVGDYSIHLDDETTYYLIDSPALATSELQLEMWFKADSIPGHDTRLIGRRGAPSWSDMNYELKFQDVDGESGYLSAGAHLQGQDPAIGTPEMTNSMILDEPIVSDMWYHAIFRVSENVEADSSLATLQLRREDYIADLENPLDSPPNFHESYVFFFDEVTVTSGGEFFIGRLFSGSPHFNGKVDGIRLYNYEKDPQEFDPELVSAEKLAGDIPETVSLEANYPNPFNPFTNINYAIPVDQHVTLTVYDALGREVATLVDEYQSAGNYMVRFDATGLSSGTYIYRLETSGISLNRQMMFVK